MVNDEENPTWAQAMKSNEEHHWRDAARTEMHNFSRHGVYVKVSEDQLLTIVEPEHQESIRGDRHDLGSREEEGQERRPTQIQGTRRGVRQSTEEQRAQLRCGAFARNNRSRRVRQFDVDAAYLQGQFEGDDGE
eukprot:1574975-Pleurochrysis_carterae.AAC.1